MPHSPSPRVASIIQDVDSTVESLLLPFSHVWNASLIRHLFCQEDAALILNLHVPRTNIADILI